MTLPRPFIAIGLWIAMFCCFLLPLRDFDGHFFLAGFVLLNIGIVYRLWQWESNDGLIIPKSPFLLLFGLFWLIAFATSITSEIYFISLIFFGFLSVLPLSFLYFSTEPFDKNFLKYALMIAGILFALLSANLLYHYYFRPEMLYNGRAHYPLANPNSTAALLSLGFFAFYGALLCNKNNTLNILSIALLSLIMLGFFSTGSRGALVGLVIGLIAFNALTMRYFKTHLKKNILALASIIIPGSIILVDASIRNTASMVDMTVRQVQSNYPLLSERAHIWEATWHMIRDNIWTGTGFGTFFLYYPEYRTGDTASAGLMAHNDVLQFFSEMGMFSPIIFLIMIGYVICKTLALLPKILNTHTLTLKTLIPFCALGAMILHSQVSFNFHILPTLFASGALMAVWFVNIEHISPSSPYKIASNSRFDVVVTKSVLSFLCLSFLAVFISFQGSELMVRHAKDLAQKEKNIQAFNRWIERAMAWSMYQNARTFALKATVPSTLIRSDTKLPDNHRYQFFKQAESLLHTSIELNPRMASFYYELSMLSEYAQDYHPKDAKAMQSPLELMAQAHILDPLHAGTTERYAKLLIADGQDKKAYEVLKGQLPWHYSGQDPISYYQLTAKLAEQFNDAKARDRARELTIRHLKKQHTAKHRALDKAHK